MKSKFIKSCFVIIILFVLVFNPVSAWIFTLTAAVSHDLDPGYFYELIKAESSFRSLAYSHKGAIGLGQVMPQTCKYISPKTHPVFLWLPPVNVNISAKYTKYLLKKYKGNHSLALASYNWGETNVDKRIGNLEIAKEKNYISFFKDIPETYSFIQRIIEE
jgi:soluble lytic murein transglycosylase